MNTKQKVIAVCLVLRWAAFTSLLILAGVRLGQGDKLGSILDLVLADVLWRPYHEH